MDALNALGLVADTTGIASLIINKLKHEDYQYKEFINIVAKTIKTVCQEYRDFLTESHEYNNFHFPKEYDEIIVQAVIESINNNETFTVEMLLPDEFEFPNSDKERLYSNIISKLQRNSIDYLVREKLIILEENIDEIKDIIKNIEKQINTKKIKKDSIYKIKSTRTPTKKIECIGRQKDIIELQKLLDKSNFVILLNGLGGIGKTELSKKYYFEKNKQYKTIFWFEYENNIKSTFVRQSKIWKNENYFEYDTDYYYEKIMNYLINQGNDTLIIIDNIDNIHDKYIHDLSRLSCNVIITSRLSINGFEEYTVGFLSLEECIELFKKNTKETTFSNKTENHIKKIVELAGYHTLTVELLAKTVAASPNLTIPKLHNELVKHGFNLKDVLHTSVPINWHNDNEYRKFFEHLKIVFDIADLQEEKNILLFLSIIPNDEIELKRFTELFSNKYNEQINLLERKGWIFIRDNKIIIHNVIQETVRGQIPPNFNNCKEFITELGRIMDSGTFDSLDEKFIYTNWALSISKYIDDLNLKYKDFLNSASWLFSELGDNDTAISIQKKCLKGIENNENYDEFNIQAYNVMSLILSKNSTQLLEALYYQKKSFILRKKFNQPLTKAYHNLALIYSKLNYNKAALKLENKVYEIEKDKLPDNSPDFAITLSTLSSLYRRLKDYDNAIFFQEKALKIRKNVKKDKFRLAKSYYLMAVLYDLTNNEKAIEYYQIAIDLIEQLNIKTLIPSICYTNIYFLKKDELFRTKAIESLLKISYISLENKKVNWEQELSVLRNNSLTNKISI